jgi:dTDP-glucose 4,6-dehydratase
LVSSGAIYGKNKLKMAIKESHNGSPDSLDVNNIYALSKKIAENITCIYSDKYEIRVVIARCFAFGGPDLPLDKHYALGNFINDILKNKEIIIKGTGNSIRSYMHQSELSEWLYLILINGKNKNVYNVGGKYPITIRELAEKIRLISRSKNNIKILNEDTINNEDIYYPDVSKFENEFGIKQVYSVENIIEEMLECAKQ